MNQIHIFLATVFFSTSVYSQQEINIDRKYDYDAYYFNDGFTIGEKAPVNPIISADVFTTNITNNCAYTLHKEPRYDKEIIYEYDIYGKLISHTEISLPSRKQVKFIHNYVISDNKLTINTTTDNPNVKPEIAYYIIEYDELKRPIKSTDVYGTTEIGYNQQGLISFQKMKFVDDVYEYYENGKIKLINNHQNKSSQEYIYDFTDSLDYKIETVNLIVKGQNNYYNKSKLHSITRDNLGNKIRTVEWKKDSKTERNFEYVNGKLHKIRTHNKTNYADFYVNVTHTYDQLGRPKTKKTHHKTISKSPSGNEDYIYTYIWDYDQNTLTLDDPSQSFGGPKKVINNIKCFNL